MLGTIGFKRLKINCIIGELPDERESPQTIEVSLKVVYDFSACSLSDELSDTIDYVSLADLCTREAREGKYRMLETYASRTLEKILREFPIHSVSIHVSKPGGLTHADCSFVELTGEKK